MSAAKYDFSIEQGSSFKFVFIYKDQNSEPIDLTNWCARLTWTTHAGDTEVFESGHDGADYKFSIDEANGKITFMIPSDITNDLNFSTAKYDVELQSPDDLYTGGGKYTIRILYGTITLIKRNSKYTTNLDCIA